MPHCWDLADVDGFLKSLIECVMTVMVGTEKDTYGPSPRPPGRWDP